MEVLVIECHLFALNTETKCPDVQQGSETHTF